MHALFEHRAAFDETDSMLGVYIWLCQQNFQDGENPASEIRGSTSTLSSRKFRWVTRLDGLNIRDMRGSKILIRQALMSMTLLALSRQFGSLCDCGPVAVTFF